MKRTLSILATGSMFLLGRSPDAAAQTTITTEPYVEPTEYAGAIQKFTIGQTFRAPNPTDLFLASFRISLGSNSQAPYTVRVMEWDPVQTRAGDVLFSQSFDDMPPAREYLTFETGTLLRYGSDYIFSVSMVGASWFYAHHVFDRYPEGYATTITSVSLDDLQNESEYDWNIDQPSSSQEWGFTAQFEPQANAVPEPASMALLGTGLLGLAASRRRRKRTKPEA